MSDAALKLLREKAETIVAGQEQIKSDLAIQRKELAELKEKAAVPQYPPGITPQNVYGSVGARHGISEGYSMLRAARLAMGRLKPSEAKYEYDCHEKLKAMYERDGWRSEFNSLLVPQGTQHIMSSDSAGERFVGELREKMVANGNKVDGDEMNWLVQKFGLRNKDLSTLVDNQGGVLVGFPTLMELVDIQRNIEVMSRAGAMQSSLPANGRASYPKLTNVTTANWIGEAASITESTPATGSLDLVAKKLAIRVDLNNELLRFNSISAENLVRTDMAKVAALKADLAMLEGTGGTQIKGLVTYTSAATWTTGTDPLLAYTVTGNLFQINDAADMEALLPDTAGTDDTPLTWVMRRQLWAKIRNRRFGASTATDSGGGYLVNFTREFGDSRPLVLDGTRVVRSTQVSATRGNGSQTYVILGYFPDWIIGRFGVLEFLSTNVSDQAFQNDQTQLRCIQQIDAGPRHASSFVFADAITIS